MGPQIELTSHMRRSHDSEAPFADFIMHCGERKWHIHRVVITAESKFFEKVCTSDFKVHRHLLQKTTGIFANVSTGSARAASPPRRRRSR